MMLSYLTFLIGLAGAFPSALEPRGSCSSGVYIIAARGTTEPQGYGLQQTIVTAILNKIPGSNSSAVVYPASFDIQDSLKAGVTDAQRQITDYNSACPSSKIVLMGYSQGAQVIGDSIAGGGTATPGTSGPSPAANPISQSIGANVIAVVLFGDPNRVKGQGVDNEPGACTGSSARPRTGSNYNNMQFYTDRLDEYCASSDPVCCSSGNNFLGHLSYFDSSNADAIANYVAAAYGSG